MRTLCFKRRTLGGGIVGTREPRYEEPQSKGRGMRKKRKEITRVSKGRERLTEELYQ